MGYGEGIDWVESNDGQRWIGYIKGLGRLLPHIVIIKEPWEPETGETYFTHWGRILRLIPDRPARGGWIVMFGEHIHERKFASLYVAQRAATTLATEYVTEALVNLQKELE